jgi:hypothetical protein
MKKVRLSRFEYQFGPANCSSCAGLAAGSGSAGGSGGGLGGRGFGFCVIGFCSPCEHSTSRPPHPTTAALVSKGPRAANLLMVASPTL